MASSIKQINRILAIDACLNSKNHSHITILDLQEFLAERYGMNVSVDTIEKDIRKMRAAKPEGGFNAPLYCDKGTNTYYYDDGDGNRIFDYVLNKLPLDAKELASLQMAADVLSQFQDRGLGASYNDALVKINNFMKIETEPEAGKIIIPETAKGKHTLELIPEFYQHIKNKKPITFIYGKPADLLTVKQTIHPYLLKEYKSAWYVIGYSVTENWVLPFDLEFIEGNLENAELDFYMHEGFNADVYFKNTIGVNVLDNIHDIEKVVLEFFPDEGQYILHHPIHPTQKVISKNTQSGNMISIEIEVYTTQELIDLILSFGDRVRLVSGNILRDALRNDLTRALNYYPRERIKKSELKSSEEDIKSNPLLIPVKEYKDKKTKKDGK
jgi:predicted DNA-binding transcriptional regulator YafY